MSPERTPMIEILSSILSRLVNVALCIILMSIALLILRDRTDLHLGVIALCSLGIGILGTIAVRWIVSLIVRGWNRIVSRPTE